MKNSYLPHKLGRWKGSTARTNTDRLNAYIIKDLGGRPLHSFNRKELQEYLNSKVKEGLSESTVKQLRSDLKLIFAMAIEDGLLDVNPCGSLHIAREARKPNRDMLTLDQLRNLLSVLPLRDRLIAKLSALAGMRPGEILALQWADLKDGTFQVQRRTYRGVIDTPKSHRAERKVSLPDSLLDEIEQWRGVCPDGGSKGWVFASENPESPLQVANFLQRAIKPVLKKLGLHWVDFRVLRRTCSSLLNHTGTDPKVVADQLGHDVGVNVKVYTQTSVGQRATAVNRLEDAVLGVKPVA
ncbi:MAG: site-specific integrase [Bryobacterales bacterium]|nr:site-specific integrase [Bryobacterales bacterium]